MSSQGLPEGDSCKASGLDLTAVATADLARELDRRLQELVVEEQRLGELSLRIATCVGDAKEVLDINAGGQIFSVRRETLMLARGSVLAAMFSGTWDSGLTRDSQHRPFLEMDPYIFGKIVNHLRQKLIEGPDAPAPLPVVDPEKATEYRRVVEYFGLAELFGLAEASSPVSVQSFACPGPILESYDAKSRGYLVRLQSPVRLKAVLVGLGMGHDAVGAKIVVGQGSSVFHEATLQQGIPPEWATADDKEVTHRADFGDVMLYGPEVCVMVKPDSHCSWKYIKASCDFRNAGPFQVGGKEGAPPFDSEYCIFMSIVHFDCET